MWGLASKAVAIAIAGSRQSVVIIAPVLYLFLLNGRRNIMIRYSQALVPVAVLSLATIVSGCGHTNAAPSVSSSHVRHVAATTVALPHHLSNTQWYPPAVTKHYPITGAAYKVPSDTGLQMWSSDPTLAVLAVFNHLSRATTIQQVEEYSDPSFWPGIRHEWTFPNPHSPWYHEMRKPLTAQNVESMPASRSPYAGVIQRQYGPEILDHSWVLATGQPGQAFTTWYKKHPALTPWYYFVNVRGHWLLYSIQN